MPSGIYMWTDKSNGKKYIGKANDLASRKRGYKTEIKSGCNRPIIHEMRIKGIENFDYTILEQYNEPVETEFLLEREKYWIDYYDTQNKEKGYNVLNPGEEPNGKCSNIGSNNVKARLTEEEVLYIRNKAYIDKVPAFDLYQEFKDKINYDAFNKALRGETWLNVDSSMITSIRKIPRKNLPKAKFTAEEVKEIRRRYEEDGESVNDIFNDYIGRCGRNTIKRIIDYKTWRNI